MSGVVFLKLLAIFAVVAIGWAVARSGKLGPGDPARTLASAAFYIFVPALLFRSTARIDFARLDPALLLAFFVPTLLVLGAVYVGERWRLAGSDAPAAAPSTRAITASFGNAVQVGIPLAAALFGETGLALHVTVVSLHALILLTVLTTLVELDLARSRRHSDPASGRLLRMLATTVRNTVVHPVVLPVLAGLLWNAGGVPLPGFVDGVLQMLGEAVVPLCLVLIGVSLAHYGLRGSMRSAIALSLVKLIVQPLGVLLVGHFLLGLGGIPLAVVVMMSAMPVGSNALIFAQRYQTLQAEVSASIVVSTLGFVVTAPLWLAVLQAIG